MSSSWERELKAILQGDLAKLEGVLARLPADQAAAYRLVTGMPFLVVRAAGSLGADLVALRGDISFPIEVKSSKQARIFFSDSSGRATEQARRLRAKCTAARVFPVYAYRRKGRVDGDRWRILTVPVTGLEGIPAYLHSRLPQARLSPKGNLVLVWDEGLPLHRFLERVCSPVD